MGVPFITHLDRKFLTPIESFVVALLFIGGCGFLCGIPSGHERLKRSRDVELLKVSSTLLLLALVCMPIAVVYAWFWVRRLTGGTSFGCLASRPGSWV